ncbi:hypothetical protein JCM8097_009285 [Rhodosporidiobolus ruineniae]
MQLSAALFAAASLAASAAAAPALQSRSDAALSGVIDDTAKTVTYSPAQAWVRLSGLGDSNFNGGTEAYTREANGSLVVPHFQNANTFHIAAAKKKDRGFFDVVYADQVVAVGDAHSDCEGDNCVSERILSVYNLPYVEGYNHIEVKNRGADYRVEGVPYLGFDTLTWEQL